VNDGFGKVVVAAYFKLSLLVDHLPESTCLPLETQYDSPERTI